MLRIELKRFSKNYNMEQYQKVVEHLKAAYIAAAGDSSIGVASGHTTQIGNLIVTLGGPQALFQAQRQANVARETIEPHFQKKTPMERKPSATLLNANENQVLSNQIGSSVVASNANKGNAIQVEMPETMYVGTDRKPEEIWTPTGGLLANAAPTKNALAELMESEEKLPGYTHAELMELASQSNEGDLEMLEMEYARNTGILSPDDYSGKTPKYLVDKYSQSQMEATLNHLGVKYPPEASAKQKARFLIESTKEN